jgi:hypothetical protein
LRSAGGRGLVARTGRPAIIGHDQAPCADIDIAPDDRVPGPPIRGHHETAHPPSQDALRAAVYPRTAQALTAPRLTARQRHSARHGARGATGTLSALAAGAALSPGRRSGQPRTVSARQDGPAAAIRRDRVRCAWPANRCSRPAGGQNRRCREPLPQPPIRPLYVRNYCDTAPHDGT